VIKNNPKFQNKSLDAQNNENVYLSLQLTVRGFALRGTADPNVSNGSKISN
jgi:hypothetical protein